MHAVETTGAGSPPTVIVAGCRHGGLAILQALGPLGVRLVALTSDRREFGVRSRYVHEVAVCPHPRDGEAFTHYLLDRAPDWQGALILDTEDSYTAVLSRSKPLLQEHYHVLAPDWPVAQQFLEKDRTARLADETGVPRRATYTPASVSAMEARMDDYAFPIMLKPIHSQEFNERFGRKLFIVHDRTELRRRFADSIAASQPVVLQEIIPGSDDGTLESMEVYIDRAGDVAAESYNVKLRQSPPMFGVMCAGRTVPVIPDVRELGLRLLRAVNYRGFASIEFKRDPRDGQPKLIEVNVRLPRNGQLLFASGVNFPHLILQDLVLHVPVEPHAERETHYVDLLPDLWNLMVRNRGQWRRPLHALRPYTARRTTIAAFSLRDPKPFLYLVTGKLGKFTSAGQHAAAGPVVKPAPYSPGES